MLIGTVRWLAFGLGLLVALGGVGIATTDRTQIINAIWAVIVGAGIMIAAVLQRSRYRSAAAEATHQDAGPGGGEIEPLEWRFQATTEVFVDPTTHRLMRVYVDPRSGERRYRAEG